MLKFGIFNEVDIVYIQDGKTTIALITLGDWNLKCWELKGNGYKRAVLFGGGERGKQV
jgi:hypothetical protein